MASSPTTKTVFTVVNLHCSSCVANIQDALFGISHDLTISHSIINHTVTITHPTSISVSDLSKTLDHAGFEIYNEAQSRRVSFRETLEQAVLKWGFLSPNIESRKRKRHLETCDLCRAKSPPNGSTSGSDASRASRAAPSCHSSALQSLEGEQESDADTQITVPSSSEPVPIFKATFSFPGMTCSACTNTVTTLLTEKPFVKSCNANYIDNCAVVEFSDRANADKIVEILEDAGYDDIVIQDIHPLEAADASTPVNTDSESIDGTAELYEATLTVEDMTCASCSEAVTRILEEHDWVESASVNFLRKLAIVKFRGQEHGKELAGLVEDGGYGASLEKVEPVTPAAPKNKTVAILVEGFFCPECPTRVVAALQAFEEVKVLKPPTKDDPVVEIQYIPKQPYLTIRHILHAIEKKDQNFTPSIHHPMSLEERSRRLSAQERRRILYRLILAVVVAIPSFIIGILFMSLLPEDNKDRKYLMTPIRGVRRADWAMFIMSIPIYFFAADMFHLRTLKELRALWRPGSPTPILKRFYRFGSMNMLVSLGTSIAFFSSIAELALAASNPQEANPDKTGDAFYFDSVVFLTMFLLLGRLIEAVSKAKTGDAVAALGNLRSGSAFLEPAGYDPGRENNDLQKVSIDLLEAGDVIKVMHGDSPPCDGVILRGSTFFDESSLTGESRPVMKAEGDSVFAGTINKEGTVSVRITGAGGASMLDRIMAAVREGQAKRAPVERVADTLTAYFVPFITLVAIVTWITWFSLGQSGALPDDFLDVPTGGWAFWSLEFAIAVFVVACPCGLGLAAPTALFVGGGLAAQRGILVRGGGEAFQEASQLDIVAFDKTGTLTQGGEPKVTQSTLYNQSDVLDDAIVWSIIRKLEEESGHPIAQALVSLASTKRQGQLQLLSTKEVPGRGISGTVRLENGTELGAIAGNQKLMEESGVRISDEQQAHLRRWQSAGSSTVILAVREVAQDDSMPTPWQLAAAFAIADELRPEAATVVESLQKRGSAVWMISGDNFTTASAVGAQLGIHSDHIIAGVLPTEKADSIKWLQTSQQRKHRLWFRVRTTLARALGLNGHKPQGKTRDSVVAFVGDGINDAPALTAADVSIAIGSGSDVALASASFVLLKSDLQAIPTLLSLSSAVIGRVRTNFGWALIYNLLALPVAAGALYPIKTSTGHIRLPPMFAALAMAFSSISVVLASLLLRTQIPVLGFRDKPSQSFTQRAVDWAHRGAGRGQNDVEQGSVFVHAALSDDD